MEFAFLLFLRHTPPAPNIFSVAHNITHANTPPVSLAQDRSHVPLSACCQVPSSLQVDCSLSRRSAAKKHQTPKHQTRARGHASTQDTEHSVKCEKRLPVALLYKAEPLPESRFTNLPASHPTAAACPPHKHRSPHSTAATHIQTARCLALRALRSASIPMAP